MVGCWRKAKTGSREASAAYLIDYIRYRLICLLKHDQNIIVVNWANLMRHLENRPTLVNGWKVLFHKHKAWPYITRITLNKLQKLKWELLLHPAISLNIALSDENFSSMMTLNKDRESSFPSKKRDLKIYKHVEKKL